MASRENAPRSSSAARTRPRSASASAGVAWPPARRRLRSAASTLRTASATRRRGIFSRAGSPSRRPTRTSTEGSPLRAAGAGALPPLPSRGKQRLHSLLHASNDFVGFAPHGHGADATDLGAQEPLDRFLRQPFPQLVEVARGETLPLQRARPLARQDR